MYFFFLKQKAIVYVNPECNCGGNINWARFHNSHTRFGPGLVHNVYKSILQSFIDFAYDKFKTFSIIPTGTSTDYVRCESKCLSLL